MIGTRAHRWGPLMLALWPFVAACATEPTGSSDDSDAVDADGDGWTVAEGDCDDSDPETHPGADESAFGEAGVDGLDNDCDDLVDEGSARFDDDGDGWTETTGDCDDADADVNPDEVEVADTPADEDCDGTLAPAIPLADVAAAVWWGDKDNTTIGNAAGTAVSIVGDVDGDGLPDVLVSAPTGRLEGGPRAAYLLAGPATEGGSLAAGAVATIEPSPDSDFDVFARVAPAGDVDADGLADVMVSDSRWNGTDVRGEGVVDSGRVALFLGPVSGTGAVASADVLILGQADGERVGIGFVGGEDLDGDGADDILLSGGAIFLGPLTGTVTTAEADLRLLGAGYPAEPAGDTNGDGHPDLLFGNDNDDHYAGRAWVAMGPFTEDAYMEDVSASFTGAEDNDYTGRTLSSAGDVDGDGFDDVLVGAQGANEFTGRAYLLCGPFAGSRAIESAARSTWNPEFGRPMLSTGLAFAGDLDGDGRGGALVGAPGEEFQDGSTGLAMPGKLYLFSDPEAGEHTAGVADAVFVGPTIGDGVGYAAAGGVDLDGDTVPDFVVGAPFDSEHGTETGKVYVVSGAAVDARVSSRPAP